MTIQKRLGLFSLAFCFSGIGLVRADILNSRAGLDVCLYDSTGVTCTPAASTVETPAHPLWQQNGPTNPGASDNSAVWISYANTGYGGSVFQPYKGTIPVFRVTETFNASEGDTLALTSGPTIQRGFGWTTRN